MNIDKYMKKAYGFFAKTPKEQRNKADKLQKIIIRLATAQEKLSRDIGQTKNKDKKKKKEQELKVVNNLMKKASKRMKKLNHDAT